MGLFSWLFPSPEQRLSRARAHLDARRFREARDAVDGLTLADAENIRRAADHGFVELNLEAVLEWAESGDAERVEQHFALAESLHHGGLEARFQEVRQQVRAIRAERRAALERERAEKTPVAPPADPAEERQARLWLLLANYPPELAQTAETLGADFAEAALHLEDGRPDLALPLLVQLPENHALVWWERSRAAYQLGDPDAARTALRRFAAEAGGHREIGREHSGVLLAQITSETGNIEESLRILRDLRAGDPDVGTWLYAQLLLAEGAPESEQIARWTEAEVVLRSFQRKHSTVQAVYELLARARTLLGQRVAAMQTLEQALTTCCSQPGKCGTEPPSPGVLRQLATLYLEDGVDRARGLELAEQVLAQVREPTPADLRLAELFQAAQQAPGV